MAPLVAVIYYIMLMCHCLLQSNFQEFDTTPNTPSQSVSNFYPTSPPSSDPVSSVPEDETLEEEEQKGNKDGVQGEDVETGGTNVANPFKTKDFKSLEVHDNKKGTRTYLCICI